MTKQFTYDGKLLTGIHAPGMSVTLPDRAELDAASLQNADCDEVIITEKNKSITLEWLQTARISDTVKAVRLPLKTVTTLSEELYYFDTLEEIHPEEDDEDECEPLFSEDLLTRIVLDGDPPDELIMNAIAIFAISLEWDYRRIVERLESTLYPSLLYQLLQRCIPPLPDDLRTTPDGLSQLEQDETTCNALRKLAETLGIKPNEQVHYINSEEYVSADILLRLAFSLGDKRVDCPAIHALASVNRKELVAWLAGSYSVTVTSANTQDIAPLCQWLGRICDVDQASTMLTHYIKIMKRDAWSNTPRNRVAEGIIFGLARNTSSSVLLLLDKHELLAKAASAQGISESKLRAQLLQSGADTFDECGQVRLSYGTRSFKLTLQPDLTLSVFDDQKQKAIKALPKPEEGDDQVKAQKAAKQLKQIRTDLKNAATKRAEPVKKMLLEGTSITMSKWQQEYTESVITRLMARNILWGVYTKKDELLRPFRLNDRNEAVDDAGNAVSLKETDLIGVVDAAQLSQEAREAWRSVMCADGQKSIVNQFKAPGCYIPTELVHAYFDGLTISARTAQKQLNMEEDDMGVVLQLKTMTFEACYSDGYYRAMKLDIPVQVDCKLCEPLRALTCHEKRLYNQDLVCLIDLLCPQSQEDYDSKIKERVNMLCAADSCDTPALMDFEADGQQEPVYTVVSVRFSPRGRKFDYLTDQDDIHPDDTVIVSGYDGEKSATVVEVSVCRESQLALPIGAYKRIVRK